MGRGRGRDKFIYFIKARNRIKIGVTQNTERRLADIGKHLATEPKLLGSIVKPNAYALEKHLHVLLSEHWIKNEWFEDCGAVRDAMHKFLAGDELGYQPTPSKKRIFVPEPLTHERWLSNVQYVSGLMWPDHPGIGLALAAEIPVSDAEDYLSGAKEMPRSVNCVIAHELAMWIYADVQARRKENR